MAEPLGPPPAGGDETKAPELVAVFWVLKTISILCVAARLFTRIRLLRSAGLDNVVIVISLVRVPSMRPPGLWSPR